MVLEQVYINAVCRKTAQKEKKGGLFFLILLSLLEMLWTDTKDTCLICLQSSQPRPDAALC